MVKTRNVFENLNPLDHRYSLKKEDFNHLSSYFSEEARFKWEAKVELALVETLVDWGIAPKQAATAMNKAVQNITAEDVYAEERITKHNTRALVNCLRQQVKPEYRQYIHLGATSFDIVDTAANMKYKRFTTEILIPALKRLILVIAGVAEREKNTVQIGRTHGQAAVPLTFGYYLAGFVSRLGEQLEELAARTDALTGQFSGAVGGYNALSLLVDDPRKFEKQLLKRINLEPAEHSTQIIPPEKITDYLHTLVTIFGILADISDDFRHLQRTEISETGEAFSSDQVGSSTMPQKRNPINFENVKSAWKVTVPRMITIYMDQLSEHQRDLTNSASARYYPDIPIQLYLACQRLHKVFTKIVVDKESLQVNLQSEQAMIAAEPLYILLAREGHPDAHEAVRSLTLEAEQKEKNLLDLAQTDEELKEYLNKLKPDEIKLLKNPHLYIGQAVSRTEVIVEKWNKKLNL
ncbi:MAG: lyase family protein [Bacillota bacterium]